MKRSAFVLAALTIAATASPSLAAVPTRHVPSAEQSIIFAGGCFWGIQAVFEHTKGVTSAVSGYAGGFVDKPSYEQVSTGRTGHAESVRVTFDPAQISLDQLLQIFFTVAHDPTQLNRQGPDVGTQYRSMIMYGDDNQKAAVKAFIEKMTKDRVWGGRPIVTQLVPAKTFFPAEAYHQHYADTHPNDLYIRINDAPKVEALKKRFPQLYKA
jgi:peptide-methionine (S)-S-oxide reductase